MTFESLKDLEKLFKTCRKQGVLEFNLAGIVSFKLGDLPPERPDAVEQDSDENPYKNFPQGELTPEQLMFYSAGGSPENDPAVVTPKAS